MRRRSSPSHSPLISRCSCALARSMQSSRRCYLLTPGCHHIPGGWSDERLIGRWRLTCCARAVQRCALPHSSTQIPRNHALPCNTCAKPATLHHRVCCIKLQRCPSVHCHCDRFASMQGTASCALVITADVAVCVRTGLLPLCLQEHNHCCLHHFITSSLCYLCTHSVWYRQPVAADLLCAGCAPRTAHTACTAPRTACVDSLCAPACNTCAAVAMLWCGAQLTACAVAWLLVSSLPTCSCFRHAVAQAGGSLMHAYAYALQLCVAVWCGCAMVPEARRERQYARTC